jgi:hypothetical protein
MPRVYGKDQYGNRKDFNVSSNIGSGRIVQRTNGGQINVPDVPEADSNAIGKKFADETYVKIVKQASSAHQVYLKDKNGSGQTFMTIRPRPYPNEAVQRDANSNILLPNIENPNNPSSVDLNLDRAISVREVDKKIANASLGQYANGTTFCHTITVEGEDETVSSYVVYQFKLIIYSPYGGAFTNAQIVKILTAHVGQFVTLLTKKTNEYTQLPIIQFTPVVNQVYLGVNNDAENPEKLITVTSFADTVTSI